MARRLINRRLDRLGLVTLGLAPFLLLVALYAGASALRHAENDGDKLLPTGTAFVDAVRRVAIEPDARTGDVLLWADSAASLRRLALGLLVATTLGMIVGVATGLIPYVRAGLSPLVAVASMVPPMALLPILFIVFGLGELSKVVLIVIGISPFMMRDLALRIEELPNEQLVKAQTLGLSSWHIVTRVVVPQMLPRLLDGLRLSLGPAWLFLISAEAIAAEVGLGYRIFLVRRYLAMDVIIPYVAWITTLAFLMDLTLRALNRRAFPWLYVGREA
ncbi:ABC transporter permease [bacterium]|nr:ABC transporter permease [bacterium]